jgi:hypothetical protein
VSRKAYRCELWREKPGFLFGSSTGLVGKETIKYFNLHDEVATVETIAGLVIQYGGHESQIGQYWVKLYDLDTGEHKFDLSVSISDLHMVRDGTRPTAGMSGPSSLHEVGNDQLLVEFARRLGER